MDFFDIDIEAVRREMAHEPTAEERLEQRVDFIIRELDELCAMATHPETIDMVDSQTKALGQMQTRIQLILSFLAAKRLSGLRMVQNG